jgi:NDP-sugar pyrophosphorylase family protein
MLYRRGRQVVTHACRGLASWRVSDASSYLSVNMRVVEEFAAAATPPAGFVRRGDALCHETATVDPTATFVGPSLVGARSRIEAGAVVVGPTSFGASSRVGRDAVVTRSAIWDGAIIQARAYVDGCVVTAGTVIDKGAVMRCAVCSPGRRSRLRMWLTRWLEGAEVERDIAARA